MEMDSPTNRGKHHRMPGSSMFSSIDFKSSTQPLKKDHISDYHEQQSSVMYLEGLDVFNEFEQRFNEFLRSTPYID